MGRRRSIAPVTHSDPQVVRDREALARRIVRERERLGVKQKHLAWRAGVAVETVCRIECGRVSAAPESLAKIERALSELAAGADPRAVKVGDALAERGRPGR